MIVDGRFDAAERLELIERERVDVALPGADRVPRAREADRAAAAAVRAPDGLRRASRSIPEVIDAWRDATGLEIADGYGQTETGHLVGNLVGDEIRHGSMGSPLAGVELRIVDGMLEVAVATRARPSSAATWTASRSPASGGRPATSCAEDDDGYLWYEGRDDDLIMSAGYRIGPFEVESALLTHPSVAEAAAVAAPDPERGSVVRAIVVLREGDASRRARARAPGAREGDHRPVQVPAHRRVRRRAAEDRERQDQARPAARRLSRTIHALH